MPKVLTQRKTTGRFKALKSGWVPKAKHFLPSRSARITFTNDQTAFAVCLRCPNTPCAILSESELTINALPGFPADRLPEICPSGAITIKNGVAPSIDAARCISCGVCASRCKVGAIGMVPLKGAFVNDEENAAYEEVSEAQRVNWTWDQFANTRGEGVFLEESDDLLEDIFTRQSSAFLRIGDRFPNLLARALLVGAGVNAGLARKGNNFLRMDLIFEAPSTQGVVEVEFGQEAVLNAPRDILDAVAVLVSRHGWNAQGLICIIVTDILPNRRSEYWSVLQDIKNVLGIRIGTLTVWGLMLMNWSARHFTRESFGVLYADRDTRSYKEEVLQLLLGRELKAGVIPRPQVDIAK